MRDETAQLVSGCVACYRQGKEGPAEGRVRAEEIGATGRAILGIFTGSLLGQANVREMAVYAQGEGDKEDNEGQGGEECDGMGKEEVSVRGKGISRE